MLMAKIPTVPNVFCCFGFVSATIVCYICVLQLFLTLLVVFLWCSCYMVFLYTHVDITFGSHRFIITILWLLHSSHLFGLISWLSNFLFFTAASPQFLTKISFPIGAIGSTGTAASTSQLVKPNHFTNLHVFSSKPNLNSFSR